MLNTCVVPLATGKSYSNKLLCDVVEIDATHIILGRPCKFDMDAVYKGKLNQCIIQANDRRIFLMPLSLKKTPKLVEPNFLLQKKTELTRTMNQGGRLTVEDVKVTSHSLVTRESFKVGNSLRGR